MKNLLTLLLCCFLLPATSFAQGQGCSGQFGLKIPSATGTGTFTQFNFGSNDLSVQYCPSSTGTQQLIVTPESRGSTLTLTYTLNGITTTQTKTAVTNGGDVPPSGEYAFTIPVTTQAVVYTFRSIIVCGNDKDTQVNLTLAPVLTLSTSSATVCENSTAILTSTGANSGSNYTFSGPGLGTVNDADGVLQVTPAQTTTYTVTAATACGAATQQQLTVIVPTLTVSPAAPTITSGETQRLTAASSTANDTYTLTGGGLNITNSTGIFDVAPTAPTTYTIATLNNCTKRDVTVTVKPLPVELTAFEVRTAGAVALLTWTTSQELDNEFFAVERSTDSRRFVAVGRVAGAGTTRTRTEYRFTDALAEVRAGTTLYYRLRQVDYSGLVQYSPVRALQVGARTTALLASVQPNPLDATSSLRVVTPQAGPLSYTIHDAVGRQLAAESVMAAEGAQTLALPALAAARAGLYFLVVRQGSQQQVLRLSHR